MTEKPSKKPLVIVVAGALVDADGRVLITWRPNGKEMAGLWEFPGGKIEKGETPEQALIRELKEELNIGTKGTCLAPLSFASHQYENFHLLMPLFICRRWWGDILALESQEMRWVWPKKLREFDMPPADEPLVSMLRDFL